MPPEARRVGPWDAALILAVAFNALLLAWLLIQPGPRALVLAGDNIAQFVGPLLTLALCVHAARRHRRRDPGPRWHPLRRRWAPLCLGLGALGFAAGQMIWTLYVEVLHQPPFPSWAGAGYLSAYPFLLLGILLLPARPARDTHHGRIVLDGLLTMIAVTTVSWDLVLGPTVLAASESRLATLVSAAYPLSDLLLLCCLLFLTVRGTAPGLWPVVGRLAAGLAIIIVTDSVFAYQQLHGTYTGGSLLHFGWPLGYMLVGAAAYALYRVPPSAPATTTGEDAPPLWLGLLPYTGLAVVAGLVLVALRTPGDATVKPGLYLGASVLLALVLARQVVLILDIRALYRRLSAAYTIQGQDLARYIAQLEWLRAISQRLTEARTLDAVLAVVYEGVRVGLGYDRVGVNLFDYEAGVFEDLIGTDAQGRMIVPRDRRVTLAPDSPLWRFPGIAALLRGAPYYYTTDAGAECPPELHYLFDGLPRHNVMVPLRSGDRVTGMISIDNLLSGRPIHRDEVDPLLALASQVGMAVENARLLERERDERSRLAHLANTDALTGLPNRSLLHDRLAQALRAASRPRPQGESAPAPMPAGAGLALLLMDLDRFKEVNDTLGHDCGDRLLQEVAERLRRVLHATGTVGRLGGDEFAVVLPGADAASAEAAAVALLAALETPIVVAGQALSVGASVGIALYPDHGSDAATLLRCADVAMYVAKRGHLGRACYDPAQGGHDADRLALVAALRRAIAEGELCLHYQPKIEVLTGVACGVEALVRWSHPERGPVPPDVFIPLAEQTGLIDALTRWVLEEALRQCASWAAAGLTVGMAVNLSLRNLRDPSLVDTVGTLLARHGVPAELLCLELTESVVMADIEGTRATLDRLAALGVRLAVDDFGTGYSSLAYLSRLPVQELKIDRSFVRRMAEHGPDETIVASTIGLGHSLGLSVVIEGVEDAATWRLLGQLGADTAQGYYLARPLAAEEIEPWLRQATERAARASA